MEWEQEVSAARISRLIFDAEYATGAQQKEALRELEKQPKLTSASLFFWRAFTELSNDRAVGMDLGPIPFGVMVVYANEMRLRAHEREAFFRIMRVLDNRYLTIRADKKRKEEKKQTSLSGPTGGTIIDEW